MTRLRLCTAALALLGLDLVGILVTGGRVAGMRARCARGTSRLFTPLDAPAELELRFDVAAATGTQEAAVRVNGREAGRLPARDAWAQASFRVPSAFWRRELNEIEVDPGAGDGVCVSSLEFVWTSRKGRHS